MIAPTDANRLSVIDTGTDVSFSVVRSAVPTRSGLLVNVPRFAGELFTTHVAPPAVVSARDSETAPFCV